ncbi:MAG: MgtC/SapB family protein [Candidatus Omnitrophota bacterium]|nr:MgtC/SapB family protein [Candidatus Omnitrophota bacterium]
MMSLTILIRILVSALLGGLIGFERELHGCAAGLRTHILVCMGSTLFMLTSIAVAVNYGHLGDTDPSRIAAGVVTGIGFLGAGAIIRYGASIRGLTTAASIWAVSAIGLAVGAALYEAAGITTVVTLAILILSRLEERMALKHHGKKLKITVCSTNIEEEEEYIKNVIEAYGGRIKRVVCKDVNGKKQFIFELILARTYQKDMVFEISSLSDVEDVRWE